MLTLIVIFSKTSQKIKTRISWHQDLDKDNFKIIKIMNNNLKIHECRVADFFFRNNSKSVFSFSLIVETSLLI